MSKPADSTSPRAWPITTAVAAASAAVAAVVTWVAVRPPPVRPGPVPIVTTAPVPPAWDVSHRDELLAVSQTADRAAAAGDLRAAYDGYARLLAVADEHHATDPAVVRAVATARAAQDRAFAALVRPAPVFRPTTTATAVADAATRPAVVAAAPDVHPGLRPTTAPADNPADVAPPLAQLPPPPRLSAYPEPGAADDAAIGRAIERGVTFLRGQFRDGEVQTGLADHHGPPVPAAASDPADDGRLGGGSDLGDLPAAPQRVTPVGPGTPDADNGGLATFGYSTPGIDALCAYALLHAGQSVRRADLLPTDPAVGRMLDRLKAYPLRHTYHRSLRAAALAVFNRPQDRAVLADDTRWLVTASRDGAYTYTVPPPARRGVPPRWDNSNSQYGLLGVWSGAVAGEAVPPAYWRSVDHHWTASADPAGTWGYEGPGQSLSMTCAGVASLLVCHDFLDDNGLRPASAAGQPSASVAASAGLAWLDGGDHAVAGLYEHAGMSGAGGTGYTLYALERVGLASGYKTFGRHDWYPELARAIVGDQRADGSWSGAWSWGKPGVAQVEIDTAYALLFLARGRSPVLFDKLRYDGPWDGRPHDVQRLARYAAARLERPFNWQVVSVGRDWHDWLDAPVLYVAGQAPPAKWTDADDAAVRGYANAGGLVFTHADGGSPAFTTWVRALAKRCFPADPFGPLPATHPLYRSLFKLTGTGLSGVGNGSRLVLVHSATDLAGRWQPDPADAAAAGADQVGANVFVYAAGRTDYNNRLASTWVPPPPADPATVTPVVRLRYAGGRWNPEPYAWTRFSRAYQWDTRDGLDVQTADLSDLRPGQAPLAVLTGTEPRAFTPAEAAAARAFVAAGGVLLADACGGQAAFANSVRDGLVPAAFPGAALVPLPADHPLLVPSRPFAADLRHRLPLRPSARDQLGTADVPLQGLRFGRGWVVVSRIDLTTGLLGTQTLGVVGYDPATAAAIVRNAVRWAAARAAG